MTTGRMAGTKHIDRIRGPVRRLERVPFHDACGSIENKETDVLKKTSAYTGLVIVTAAGALLTSSPAYALDSLVRGSHVRTHHRSHHRNRNWNGNSHHGRIFIRIYIYNKNNNHAVAVARPEHRRRTVIRDADPIDDMLRGGGGGATGGGAASGGVVSQQAPRTANEGVAPASSNAAPVSSTPDQSSTGAAGAPSTTGAAPAALDEATTGNVSP